MFYSSGVIYHTIIINLMNYYGTMNRSTTGKNIILSKIVNSYFKDYLALCAASSYEVGIMLLVDAA